MLYVFGTKDVTWDSLGQKEMFECRDCGFNGPFDKKRGMNFCHVCWIPLIPISGTFDLIECPQCHARYRAGR